MVHIGIILVSTDYTIEKEFSNIENIVYSKIPCNSCITKDSLLQLEPHIIKGALDIPSYIDIIIFGCTSASLYIGPEHITRTIQKVHPGVPVITPITAVLALIKKLKKNNIGLVSPYIKEVEDSMIEYFQKMLTKLYISF